MTVKRPVLRWHGGKWKLAPWIIQHFPQHRTYVEPFGGAGSVLMRKERSYAEVWNDLDEDVVNLFRVLRSPDADELVRRVYLTPFSKADFIAAYGDTDCPIERARFLVVRSFMGFGSNGHARKTGFRANSNRNGTTPAKDWANYPASLEAVVERLRGVIVENKDAVDVMRQHDSPQTLHYVDPPYVPETRDRGSDYNHEMTVEQHADLLSYLASVSGMVVLSGYPSELYENSLSEWTRVVREALADGARKRTEVLWLNPACAAALNAKTLFTEAAE